MSAPIETLLSRLDGLKQLNATTWKARCPAHNGDGQSLWVTDKENGYILVHCFAHECSVQDVLAAIGMTISDLLPERLPDRRAAQARRPNIPVMEVLRVMRHELSMVEVLMSDFANGTLTFDSLDRGLLCAQRLRKALDLCSA